MKMIKSVCDFSMETFNQCFFKLNIPAGVML